MGKEIGIDFGTTNTVVSYYNKKNRLRTLNMTEVPLFRLSYISIAKKIF